MRRALLKSVLQQIEIGTGDTPHMSKDTVIQLDSPEAIDPLTDLLRTGARKLIEEAVQAELAELMLHYQDDKTSEGRQRVVRNGYQPERQILTGIGEVPVKMPKTRSREGEPVSFHLL